jgi:hypothetical protein
METSTHACDARRNEVVCGLSQRPSRERKARLLATSRGSATINTAAATPPTATIARPARTPIPRARKYGSSKSQRR